ncbi:sulfotransferase domain-containing protein [Candidatus Thiosymbion oneisti]|uniref:sulfotransferase domain-containing protein n=1 Tax=Candidatus Thiosymbion oneisti TaxID=589554 RepID=UPI000B7D1984|nr:sulfotransferase domain-containing protein [Candidatus Thiosymbion oneisti]
MNRPNFLILGATKCGTTALYEYLGQHPDVCLSRPKEPHFFHAEYEKGLEYYWTTYYAHWNGETAVGEAHPVKLFLPFVARRIRASVPDARLIVILRNPVDRALSQWWMYRCDGYERLSFPAAIRANLKNLYVGNVFEGEAGARRWKGLLSSPDLRPHSIRTYLDRGYYARQLKCYLALFPASQLKVVLFDDLRRDAATVVRELWKFLEVDPAAPLGELLPMNPGPTRQMFPVVRLARRLGINELVPRWLVPRMRYLESVIGSKPKMDPATRQWLVTHYDPHVRELEELLGRDLSHWRK